MTGLQNSTVSIDSISNLVIEHAKILAAAIRGDEKLSGKDATILYLRCLSLGYILADRELHGSLSPSDRSSFADVLHIKLQGHLTELGLDRDTATRLLDSSIAELGIFASKLLPSRGESGFKGTLFWEFGRITSEDLNKSTISQLEASMATTEVGVELVQKLRPAQDKQQQNYSNKSPRKNTWKVVIGIIVAVIVVSWIVDSSNSSAQCESDLEFLKARVERSEQYLNERDRASSIAMEYHNEHIPQHNQYVDEYNTKLSECK